MSDLIDRQAFIERERKLYCKDCDRRQGMKNGKLTFCYEIGDAPCRSCWLDDVLTDLENAPTIDAVEVVHGEWIRVENDDSYHYECSRCGERPLYSRYGDVVLSGTCPMCGARMDGERREP